ncbi:hypothetical protein PR048_010733 [Dryococelus australis]|uniref:Uncharacterized protein n=1 Tax=Dryococelus australis TaxID=614101 RepID=A0ABQ9I5H0_9NEOP|nr:hypothetical protein PR048_010733 [Dryococelus australis]
MAHINHRHVAAAPVPSLGDSSKFQHILATSGAGGKPAVPLQDAMHSAPQRIKSHIGAQPSVGDPRIQHSALVVPASTPGGVRHAQSPPPPPPPPFHRPPVMYSGTATNTQNPPPTMRTNLITVPIQDSSGPAMERGKPPPMYHHYGGPAPPPPPPPQYSPYGVPPPPQPQPPPAYYPPAPQVGYQTSQYGAQTAAPPPPYQESAQQYSTPPPPPPQQWPHPSNPPTFYR